jgi:GNAT superfamily N-acetyltransferase
VLNFRSAGLQDFIIVKRITRRTIKKIYPAYYPKDVVSFFLKHHSDANILRDIKNNNVYLLEVDGKPVGTGSISDNEIGRVFVLPECQRRGYGTMIMNQLETIISKNYSHAKLSASLPAFNLYLKRGYTSIGYHQIKTVQGKVLCYHEMEKPLVESFQTKIDYNNRIFISVSNTENGEVSTLTKFYYRQNGKMICAEYHGGEIKKGFLIGYSDELGNLDFTYQHLNSQGVLRTGKCRSTPEFLTNGKIRLSEKWQWTNGDQSNGQSIIEEL